MIEEYPGDQAPESPAERARRVINTQADVLAKMLVEAEEQVAHIGADLDRHKQARETLFEALRATEKLRAGLNGDPVAEDTKLTTFTGRMR